MSFVNRNVQLHRHVPLYGYIHSLKTQRNSLFLSIIMVFKAIILIIGFIVLLCGVIQSSPILLMAGVSMIGVSILLRLLLCTILIVLSLRKDILVEKRARSGSEKKVSTVDIETQTDLVHKEEASGFQQEFIMENRPENYLGGEVHVLNDEDTIVVGNRIYKQIRSTKYEYQVFSNSHHQ